MIGSSIITLLLGALLAIGTSHLVGALLARPHIRRLHAIAGEVMAVEGIRSGDRAWLKTALLYATGRSDLWVASAIAPFVAIYTLFDAISSVARGQSTEEMEEELDKSNRALVRIQTETDPTEGLLWNSDLRREAFDEAIAASVLSKPLALLWLGLWIMPAACVLVFAGASRTIRPFFEGAVSRSRKFGPAGFRHAHR